ncbi:MAG: SAV_915 family protein [Trebonia sp.]
MTDLTDQQRLVAVPAHPGAGEQVIFEARRQGDEVVLPVFSSVPALVAALGESQPWALLPLTTVAASISAGSADRLVIDPEVTDEAWRWEPRDLGGFAWPGGRHE